MQKFWCIRWKHNRKLATVTIANVVAIFETRKEARGYQVDGTVVVSIMLPNS